MEDEKKRLVKQSLVYFEVINFIFRCKINKKKIKTVKLFNKLIEIYNITTHAMYTYTFILYNKNLKNESVKKDYR